jgi:tight adherence protein B
MRRKKPVKENPMKGSKPASYLIYQMNRNEKTRFLFFCGLSYMFVFYLFYHSIFLSLMLSCLSYPSLALYSSYLGEKRRSELKEQFRDLLYSISASVTTGRQLPEALQEAEQNMRLIYQDDAMIVLELADMVKRLNEYRESEEEILKDFADRACIEDISNFVDIYLTCRETGGDLVKVIAKSSDMIMDKIEIEREIRTITSQKRFEAKILTAIPFFILFLLQAVSPDYLAPMYDSLQGRILMTVALTGISASYLISMKMTKIEV